MIAFQQTKIVLFLIVLLFTDRGIAIEVRDISIATIPVSDQSPKTFQKSLPQALEQVLIRMSGNTGIMTLPLIQDALPKINNYVEKYSYLAKADKKDGQQLLLRIVFNTRAMRDLLENANQEIWSVQRPLTMVWVSVPNAFQSETLASSESQNPIIRTIKRVAFLRGLPIIFPIMDLEDQTNVALSTSTLLSNRQLQIISQRYGIDSILAGVVAVDANGRFQGEWRLFLNGTHYEWQTTGIDLTQVVMHGINRAADMILNQFAIFDKKGIENLITMEVNGVQTLDDYVHMVSLLKHVSLVMKVSVIEMSADVLLLKIKTVGNVEDLVKALKFVSNLIAEDAPSQKSLKAANLFYRWKSSYSPQFLTFQAG